MMSPGIEPIDLTVQHMGNRVQRDPVTAMTMRERPRDAPQGQAIFNLWNGVYLNPIVIVDEFKSQGLPEDRQHQQRQGNRDA